MSRPLHLDPADLLALGRLGTRGVSGITDVVQTVHSRVSVPAGGYAPTAAFQTGVTALVYGGLRAVTGLVDRSLAVAATQVTPSETKRVSPGREALVAALNGVFGDYLVETDNHLAVSMGVRRRGRSVDIARKFLKSAFSKPSPKILVLVHGLCMNDLQWKRGRHDHGAALCRDLGYTPVYLHYNSGLHVSENGRRLALLLENLVEQWPVPVEEIAILGHSMGGLVARSACYFAERSQRGWLSQLRKIAFLGTPHQGAPFEQLGNFLEHTLQVSPYTSPFARLGHSRSPGVTDMRYGNLLDSDWEGRDRFERTPDCRSALPLPEGVECYAVAASTVRNSASCSPEMLSDGLVPVSSALGRHENSSMDLRLADDHTWIAHGMNHWDLLSRRAVYEKLRGWFES